MTAKLHYDGHGINDATGQRLFTRQRTHADQGGGYVQTDAEARALAELMAMAPGLSQVVGNFFDQVAAYDDALNVESNPRAPTGDDYNALYWLVHQFAGVCASLDANS